MKIASRSLFALLALTPFALRAQAQTATPAPSVSTETVHLDKYTVTGDRAPSLTIPALDAARADLARTPGGTEVVDAERYLTGHASTLVDTFFLSPGVFVQSRSGFADDRISIRGSGLQRAFGGRGLRMMQDGVPINLADGNFDMMSLEPTAAAYINIWRGGNALAYGSSMLGGAIDYVSRTGRNSPGGIARLEVGSWNYLRATVSGGAASKSTDVYASFTQQTQDSYRDHAKHDNQRFFANAGVRLSEKIETRFYVVGVKNDSELPGALFKSALKANPEQAAPGNSALDQKRDFDLVRVANKTSVISGPDTTWSLVAAWTYKDLDHPIFQVLDYVSNDALLGLNVDNSTDLFGRKHRLRAGVLYNRGQTDIAQFNNVAGARGALRQQDDQVASNLEAFVESQLSLGAGFTTSVGLAASHNVRKTTRLATFNSVGVQVANPGGTTYDRTYDNLSPKIGIRWDNNAHNTQVYANVSGSYEPPSFSEAGTTGAVVVANKDQTATTFEIGTRGDRSFLRWDASVYHSRIRDELLAITLPGPVTGTLNADKTIHQGIELGFEADLLGNAWKVEADRRVVLRMAWTYGDIRFDGPVPGVANSNDNRIAGIPPHLVRGELMFETERGWYVGPTFEWVPVKAYVDHANTLSADPYSALGFKLGRRVAKGLSWFVEARNLTDKIYTATTGVIQNAGGADAEQFYPGDGRSVYAGLEYRW